MGKIISFTMFWALVASSVGYIVFGWLSGVGFGYATILLAFLCDVFSVMGPYSALADQPVNRPTSR